jgi:aspartyl protease family protein
MKAQESPNSGKKYGPDVVAKAQKYLEDVGLRQSGKVIQASKTSEIARAISGLAREKRELKLVYREWKQVADQIASVKQEQERLKLQYTQLNLELARVASGDTAKNNQIVGLINATNGKRELLNTQLDKLKEALATKRGALNAAESAYAETVLAIRGDYRKLRDEMAKSMTSQQVQIALRVMHANFETPEGLTADKILLSLDKRIQRIEQEVFSESIKMDVERGSLYVDVVVGKKSIRMVVDSGATLVTLPKKSASALGITIPPNARDMRLILADGRAIPAKAVTLARVRVGEFEAENVEAAVLDSMATDAEPLLGMSYLGNFKFEINSNEKTLKMLRVKAE